MFHVCNSLMSLNILIFETRKVENTSGLFSSCRKLKEIDFSYFIFENNKDKSNMFYDCQSL